MSFDLELTKKCNLNCIYCYADGGQPNPCELADEEICRVIDEATSLGAKKVTFTGGEPLMHKHFFDICEYAREAGLQISVYTNGTLIDSRAAEKIAELEIFPCVKLDAIAEDIQDRLAGVEGAFDLIMRGINNLAKVGYSTNYQMNINTVICSANIGNLPELWSWARRHNIQPSFLRLGPKGRARGNELAVKTSELRELFVRLSKIDGQFGEDWEPTTPFCGGGCNKQFISCYVSSQGLVQPCAGVDIQAGSIRDACLKEILASSRVFKIARNMDKYIKGACKTCEHSKKCYGCRGLAFYLKGDFTQADPLCWNNPLAI